MPVEVLRTTEAGNPKPVNRGAICVEFNRLTIKFSEPRGFGDSQFSAVIGPDQFTNLARAMMRTNPTEAMKAFGEALKRGIREPLDPMRQWRAEWEDRDEAQSLVGS